MILKYVGKKSNCSFWILFFIRNSTTPYVNIQIDYQNIRAAKFLFYNYWIKLSSSPKEVLANDIISFWIHLIFLRSFGTNKYYRPECDFLEFSFKPLSSSHISLI